MGDWKDTLAYLAERMRETETANSVVKMTTTESRTNRPAMTLAQKIAIHRDLEAALERIEGEVSLRGDKPLPKWRYKDGQSDATIAAKHGVGDAAVGGLRLELFGALQRADAGISRPGILDLHANIRRINEQLAEFARRMEALENAITSPDSLDRTRELERNRVVSITQNGTHKEMF